MMSTLCLSLRLVFSSVRSDVEVESKGKGGDDGSKADHFNLKFDSDASKVEVRSARSEETAARFNTRLSLTAACVGSPVQQVRWSCSSSRSRSISPSHEVAGCVLLKEPKDLHHEYDFFFARPVQILSTCRVRGKWGY